MRLNPEESLEWLREYEPVHEAPAWAALVYDWMHEQLADESRRAAETLRWAKEKGLLEHPVFTEGKPLVFPVKTGRNRP